MESPILASGTTGDADATPRRLVVGLVRGIHGLRGAVRIEVLTDDPARFDAGAELFAEGSDEPLTVDWSQTDGPGILIRFRERSDRAAVEPLRDSYLEALVAPDARPAGSWYWHEVTGAHVTTATGEDLGTVTDIFRTGGSEVFVVEGARGEILIPAVSAIMVEFAPADGRIVVDGEALALDETEPRSKLRADGGPPAPDVPANRGSRPIDRHHAPAADAPAVSLRPSLRLPAADGPGVIGSLCRRR